MIYSNDYKMKPDEIRSHRLNQLLRIYLNNPNPDELYLRAKQMGVTNYTAKKYVTTVINKANTMGQSR